ARAKGLAERVVVLKHVVRNALTPVVTPVALQMPAVFGGAIVTEQIFRVPGISSMLANDTPVIMAVTVVFACLVILFNLIADLLYGWLDPRIAYRGGGRAGRPLRLAGARDLAALSPAPPGRGRRGDPGADAVGGRVRPVPLAGADQRHRFQRDAGRAVLGASVRHRRSRPGSARAHALWRAHLAVGRARGDARRGRRRHHRRRDRRRLARQRRHGADVADRPVPVAARPAAAAVDHLSVPRRAEGAGRAAARRLHPDRRGDRRAALDAGGAAGPGAVPVAAGKGVRRGGARPWRQVVRHILPNSLGPVIVAGTVDVAAAIIAESTLSFLGLGFPPDIPTWGRILYDAKDYLDIAPHWALFAGGAIFLAVLSINFVGDGLRDALDPRRVM